MELLPFMRPQDCSVTRARQLTVRVYQAMKTPSSLPLRRGATWGKTIMRRHSRTRDRHDSVTSVRCEQIVVRTIESISWERGMHGGGSLDHPPPRVPMTPWEAEPQHRTNDGGLAPLRLLACGFDGFNS
jgi:hypothetical protein